MVLWTPPASTKRKTVFELPDLRVMEIPQVKIRFKDFAFDTPAYDNNTWEGRERSRRVDIQFKPIVF